MLGAVKNFSVGICNCAPWTAPFCSYFEFDPVDQQEMPFKDISSLELWLPFCSVEQNYLCNFGSGHHEKLCKIILNLDQ